MKFAILGSGNGARAWSAQIAAKGHEVVLWEPLQNSSDYPKLSKNKQISLIGDIVLTGHLADVTMDIGRAMNGATVVMIIVPSFAHEPIFEKMIPHLVSGQHIVIVPGNFGAWRLKKMMETAKCHADITISVTETMPYTCRIKTFDSVSIFKKKFCFHVATSPTGEAIKICKLLNDIFAGYETVSVVDHILMQDISNFNYTLHPYPVLLNYGEIEKHPTTFQHYVDGITPLIGEQMQLLDDERLAIGAKMGFKLTSTMQFLKDYYGNNDTKSIFEYVHSPESPYLDLVGQSVRSRYTTEDIPGLVMPVACLAKKAGIPSPRADTIVNIASQLHGVDYWTHGTTMDVLGLADKSIEQILKMLS